MCNVGISLKVNIGMGPYVNIGMRPLCGDGSERGLCVGVTSVLSCRVVFLKSSLLAADIDGCLGSVP